MRTVKFYLINIIFPNFRLFKTDFALPGFLNCATLWIHCKNNPNGFLDYVTFADVRNNYCSSGLCKLLELCRETKMNLNTQ